jgi:hypothetical protein
MSIAGSADDSWCGPQHLTPIQGYSSVVNQDVPMLQQLGHSLRRIIRQFMKLL